MTDPDDTLTTQLFAQENGRATALLGVTILWHPDVARIGEQFLGPAGEGSVELSRYAPLFFRPGTEGIALGHRAIARTPLQLRRSADDSLIITPPDSRMAVEVNGQVLDRVLQFDRADVARGVVLGLGGHVLLCVHWMTSFPRANALHGLLGVSSAAIATRELIRQVASTDLSVLLLGETGTGKDVAARAIHAAGKRAAKPLVAVNMATLNEALAAADLFGAVKGAYTGAQNARHGLFAEADGGTLFLDELGDTPASVQPMLLRVLETGSYRPLGASVDATSSARLIAASDQDLDARGFNQPLLRRMEAFVIRIPPLRERREDIGVLLLEALRACTRDSEEMAAFPPGLISEMCTYDWPGNIRQLVNVTRRKLAEIEDADLLGAMEANGWQISGAAQQLGVSRPSLYKLIEAHPLIRAAAAIPADEVRAAWHACGADLAPSAATLKTPSEALRRHLRGLGLESA